MIRPNLTFEAGLSRVGESPINFEWKIDQSDPLVRAIKTHREAVYNLTINYGEAIHMAYSAVMDFLGTRNKVLSLAASSAHNTIRPMQITYGDALEEVISNAVEHGTQYGENGITQVRGVMGDEGVVFGIAQPTPGMSQKYLKWLSRWYRESTIYRNDEGKLHGRGSDQFRDGDGPDVWSVDLENGGAEVIVAWTCEQFCRTWKMKFWLKSLLNK